MTKLDATFWSQRYQDDNTGWDIGHPSTPLKEFIDQLNDKDISILIPGAGNAYEAGYLLKKGFKNVHVVDLAQEPLDRFKASYPKMPIHQLIRGDFFDHSGHSIQRLSANFLLINFPFNSLAFRRNTF